MATESRAIGCPAWAPPLVALQFLTRVPVPGIARLSSEVVHVALGRAVGWFPLVGALVGAVTATTLLLTEQLWPRIVAVIIALVVEARLTGAFHEDAVADFCDGIGGGRDPTHVREIMKDSRIGSYGAVGLGLAMALRAALMLSLQTSPFFVFASIVAAGTFGRLLVVIAMITIPPAPAPTPQAGLAKDIGGALPPGALAVALVTSAPGLVPFALIAPLSLLFAAAGAGAFLIWFRSLLIRRLGGSTGDCLGFAVYIGQIILLLAATAS